jgi:3-oxoacyl-[acyl-carrier-protein] synthase III
MAVESPPAIGTFSVVVGERVLPAEELAQQLGCSVAAVARSVGTGEIRVTDAIEGMGVRAARLCLERAGVDDIDAVIAMALPFWRTNQVIQGLQHQLRLKNVAVGVPLVANCATPIMALRLARTLLDDDPRLRRVLVLGGSTARDTPRASPPPSEDQYQLIMSDGGFAAIVERAPGIELLGFGGGSDLVVWDLLETLARAPAEEQKRQMVQVLHASRDLHRKAIGDCLKAARIEAAQIDHVLFSREPVVEVERSILNQMQLDPARLFHPPRLPTHTGVADQFIRLEALRGLARAGQIILMVGRTYGVMH